MKAPIKFSTLSKELQARIKEELSYDYNQDKVEVIRPTTPNGLTIIHLGIADTVVIKPADLADIKRLSDGDMLWFKDGDNLNAKWEVTFKGDKITFKGDSSVITVTREELFGKEEATAASEEFKLVEKSLSKYLDSIIVEPTLTDRIVPVDSYKINSIHEETRLKGHLGSLVIDVSFKKANYLPSSFEKGLLKDLETLLGEWSRDELSNPTHFIISLGK